MRGSSSLDMWVIIDESSSSHSCAHRSLPLLAVMGALLLLSWPGFVRAQDAPAADCGSGPNVVCPASDDPSAQYIGSVTALPDGIVILLTNDGLDKARDCGGPETIAAMAQALYASIPLEERAEFQLDWSRRR
ncbi:MAG: hypothetical protein R2848_05965 [Thermomicrobiales bacterium]